MRRLLAGAGWFILFYVGAGSIGGAIVGAAAGSHAAGVGPGFDAGLHAGQEFHREFGAWIFYVSLAAAALGTAARKLPGTRGRRTAESIPATATR
jgi:hypothetical protein